MKNKPNFQYMSLFLSNFIHKSLGNKLGSFYDTYWNPINYAIIGSIGVLINMMILLPLSIFLPLWLANILAILTAWTWNWTNSVGPLGYLWGFNSKKEEKK